MFEEKKSACKTATQDRDSTVESSKSYRVNYKRLHYCRASKSPRDKWIYYYRLVYQLNQEILRESSTDRTLLDESGQVLISNF
jgi:hypothetical protein